MQLQDLIYKILMTVNDALQMFMTKLKLMQEAE